MLARPERDRCIECGKRYGAADFAYWHGRIADGPAYWCDRGILCSTACSLGHYRKRVADGTAAQDPAPDPFSYAAEDRN